VHKTKAYSVVRERMGAALMIHVFLNDGRDWMTRHFSRTLPPFCSPCIICLARLHEQVSNILVMTVQTLQLVWTALR